MEVCLLFACPVSGGTEERGARAWGGPPSKRRRRPAIDKTITTALLVIAGVVAAIMVVNAVFPAITRSSNSIVRTAQKMDERIETQISIVYGAAEMNASGVWTDTDSDGYFDVWVWVKNVGSARILGADQSDVFFGKEGNFQRVPHTSDTSGYPRWTYSLENGAEWNNTTTAKLNLTYYSTSLSSDTYTVKVVTPSGAYDSYFFSF